MLDKELSTTRSTFSSDAFSTLGHITGTCFPSHNIHFKMALHLLLTCPVLRHAKQHLLLFAMSLFSSMLIFYALKQASLKCDPSQKMHAILLGLQLTRSAVVGTTVLLLLDSIFCGFIPLTLFPKLKPWMAVVILSSLS